MKYTWGRGPERVGRIASPFFFLFVQPKLMQLLSSHHDDDDGDSHTACGLVELRDDFCRTAPKSWFSSPHTRGDRREPRARPVLELEAGFSFFFHFSFDKFI